VRVEVGYVRRSRRKRNIRPNRHSSEKKKDKKELLSLTSSNARML
jgi:hypothetical protein